MTSKGNGIIVEIPKDAQSWLSVIGIDTHQGIVKFKATKNEGGDRATTIVFKTTEAIRDASVEELLHAPSMNEAAAENVYRFFHPDRRE